MKHLMYRFKKKLAVVLSVAMVAGFVPTMSGGVHTVQAETGGDTAQTVTETEKKTEPSVSAYATKEQMMDTTFAPDSSGNATNIGKLVFGKNSSEVAQEWYILGKDDDVSGDNTIIFAASPIATGQRFDLNNREKTINTTTTKCGAYDTTGNFTTSSSTTVNANHYGASPFREALQRMLEDERGSIVTSYFSATEQKLMNATTVTTTDTHNNATYTTTDTLYALAAGGVNSTTIKAGSGDSTMLSMSSYWSSGEWFWLRSPCDNASFLLYAGPGDAVGEYRVIDGLAVQPASNLKLKSVLFASAATVATSSDTEVSGTISDGTAMTLRLDGTDKNIGTVTYNTATGDIKATKGSVSGDAALVVQGNDGTNDWYYSKQITGADTETVTVDDINAAIESLADVASSNTSSTLTKNNLSSCHIWLETTADNVTYAVNAIEPTTISSVSITDIDEPSPNTALDTEAACETEGVSTTSPQLTWTEASGLSASETAEYNTAYTASVTLAADIGYEFAEDVTATVTTTLSNSVIDTVTAEKNKDGTVTVTCTFLATAKDKLTSIETPQAITVANGTAYEDMNLPERVNIETEGGTESSVAVEWDTTTPASGSYNPAVLTEQKVTLNGTVSCPEIIDANGVSLATTITVTVSAAGIVGAPTADIPVGTYTENQSVTLTSSTKGATIYYTTDESEPTLTDGAPDGTTKEYTAPISVTGTEGKSVATSIKAIAVKSGMQNSEVETFAYTIAIPVTKYTITASTGTNGTISPAGAVTVAAGDNQTFAITPDSGYEIDTLKVDDVEVTAATSYTFSDVNANHTIEVTFKQESQTPDVPDAVAPSITTQPDNSTVKAGEPATFTVAASGDALTYQWQIDRNDGEGWVDIEGATEASYTTATTDASCNGYQYKCVITSSTGTVESEVITLTVDDADNKDTASKDTDDKDTGSKDADNKGTNSNDTDNKGTNSNDTDNKVVNSKDTDSNAGSESREVKVTKISITGFNHHLAAKQKMTLKTTVTPSDASNKGVTYKCSNTKYATVSSTGVVKAKKAGAGKTVTITATAKDGSGVKAAYKIKICKNAVTAIEVTAPTTAKAGSKVRLQSKVTPNKGACTKVSYKCLTPQYASVSAKGVVKIQKNAEGKTIKLRVTARDGSNTKKIVKIKVTSNTIQGATATYDVRWHINGKFGKTVI